MTITQQIQDWLSLDDNVTNANRFAEGASLLLRLTNNKYQYNYLVKNWQSNVQKSRLVYELKKHLRIKLSGITLQQIEEMRPKANAIGEEVTRILTNETKEGKNKGKRRDHDLLPPQIQALYIETYNLLRKERSLHEKLKMMEDAKPCDRHEYIHMLIQLDVQRHEDWKKYDAYVLTEEDKAKGKTDIHDTVKVVKSISAAEGATSITNCRTFISRNLPKAIEAMNDETKVVTLANLVAELQSKYETLVSLGANLSDKTIEKLKSVGVIIK